MSERQESAVDRTRDELELQAWLARAEFRHPSLRDAAVRGEVDALARTREELRLQLHLGRMEARDEWVRLEDRWQRLKVAAGRAADETGESFHDLLDTIREGYRSLRG
jgi:hypothetical protein